MSILCVRNFTYDLRKERQPEEARIASYGHRERLLLFVYQSHPRHRIWQPEVTEGLIIESKAGPARSGLMASLFYYDTTAYLLYVY